MIEYKKTHIIHVDMNTLPQQPSTDQPIGSQSVSSIGMGKEVEQIGKSAVEIPTDGEQNKDTELPKEVKAAGVRMQQTTVVLPIIVQKAGVKAINPVVQPSVISKTITLPLTDEQIAKGLHESIISSVRWLAQWCERRLKQLQYIYARPSI